MCAFFCNLFVSEYIKKYKKSKNIQFMYVEYNQIKYFATKHIIFGLMLLL